MFVHGVDGVPFRALPLQDVGVAREEVGKLQESLRLMGDEVTTAERAQSRATSELAAVQRMLR